jgi:hypothetical protein
LILFCLDFFVPMIFAWCEFAANVCRGPEIAITVSGSVIDFGGSASPETRSLCCLYDFGCNFAAFVDYYCGDFGFLVGLVVQGKKSDNISPGQLVAERTQLQVDVKNGVSLASPFH